MIKPTKYVISNYFMCENTWTLMVIHLAGNAVFASNVNELYHHSSPNYLNYKIGMFLAVKV